MIGRSSLRFMRLITSIAAVIIAGCGWISPAEAREETSRAAPTLSWDRLTVVGVPFIANEGQLSPTVAYYAKTLGSTMLVTRTGELVLALPSVDSRQVAAVHLSEAFPGARVGKISGEGPSPTRVSIFKGSDSAQWRQGGSTYQRVSFGELYDGIDLTLQAYGSNVEKVFRIQPGADPAQIFVQVSGALALHVAEDGELHLETAAGTARYTRPVAYQVLEDRTQFVEVVYSVVDGGYTFELGDYDTARPLVIDPMLATYLGGDALDQAMALKTNYIALDDELYVYVVGTTSSLVDTFPTHAAGAQPASAGSNDAFVARLDRNLTMLALTFIGGSGDEDAFDLAIHPASSAVFVTGNTDSADFPTAPQADRGRGGDVDAFVARLSPDLTTLEQSTYLGGTNRDFGLAIAIDQPPPPAASGVYLVGSTRSSDLPLTAGAAQANKSRGEALPDAFVARLSPDLTPLQISYLGGGSSDSASAVAIDTQARAVYVAGQTSYDGSAGPDVGVFPWTQGGARAFGGSTDAFVVRLDAALTVAHQATYVGGGGLDFGQALAVHPGSGEVYLAGGTSGDWDPPPSGGAYTVFQGAQDAFVVRLASDLTQLASATFLGGSAVDRASGLLFDPSAPDSLYVLGWTRSSDLPDTAGGDRPMSSGSEAFVARVEADLSTVQQATYVGGSAADESLGHGIGHGIDPATGAALIFVAGTTGSDDLPTSTAATVQPARAGSNDAFVVRLRATLTGGDSPDDEDKDGVLDDEDNCPAVANPAQGDADGDGVGNHCDNCQAVANPDQEDVDSNKIGDACEANPGPTITITQDPPRAVLGDRVNLSAGTGPSLNPVAYIRIYRDGLLQRKCYDTACTIETRPITALGEVGVLAVDTQGTYRIEGRVPDIATRNVATAAGQDGDGDLRTDIWDNCPDVSNADQADFDADGVGDACDACCPGCRTDVLPPEYCCLPAHGSGDDCSEDLISSGGRYYWELIYTEISDDGCGCFDSDGEDYFGRGAVFTETFEPQSCGSINVNGPSTMVCNIGRASCTAATSDTCANGWTVREAVCGPSGLELRDVECPEQNPICEDGRCLCPDSDGGLDFYVQGSLLTDTDECFLDPISGEVRLRERYCGDNGRGGLVVRSIEVNCPFGCSQGACSCEDDDGGNNPDLAGRLGTDEDRCTDQRTLLEFYPEVVPDPLGGRCLTRSEVITCDGLCLDGACQPPTCTDRVQNQGEEEIDCGGPCVACDLCSLDESDLPVRFNWADHKGRSWISPIRDQASCGSCAAFAGVAAVEAKTLIEHTNGWIPFDFNSPMDLFSINVPDLSEQALLSDCTESWVDCTGGGKSDVLSAIRDDGIVDELCLRYASGACLDSDDDCVPMCGGNASGCSSPESCPNACDLPRHDWSSRIWTIDDHSNYDERNDVSGVKHELVCNGPLATCTSDWGHCVTIIGWDADSDFCRASYGEDGCWILKNSHGRQNGQHSNSDSYDDDYWVINGFVYLPFDGHDYSGQIRRNTHHVTGVNPPATWIWLGE